MTSYRQRAAQRYAARRLPTAPSSAIRTRLAVLALELERVADERDAARLLVIIAEGLHEGLFLGVTYHVRRPLISIRLELDGPPHEVSYTARMPLAPGKVELRQAASRRRP
jgi:hypothetical protein